MTIPRRALVGLAVAALAVFAFLPALRNDFAWDDDLNFLLNHHYRGLGWAQLRWMFTTAYLGPYQPLAWLSAGLDYSLWGLHPAGYHAVNLLLHAANAALAYLLSLRLLAFAVPEAERERGGELVLCAGVAAALFAVHPLRVEAVAWATERRTVLAGFFYLSAILLYLRGRIAASAGLFALSLLSKGIGVALPVTLLALDAYPLRRPLTRAVLKEKAPFFLIALAFGLVELYAYSHHPSTRPDYGLLMRAGRACWALLFYALKTAAPFGLSPAYAPPSPAALCVSVAAVATVAWLAYRERERRPFAPVALIHYAATSAPVLGVLAFGDHLVADRYSYLACIAWPVLVAGGLLRLREKAFRPALAAAALLVAGLGALSWRQTGVWRDSVTLWTRALTLDPGSAYARRSLGYSYYNIGNEFLRRGEAREAWRYYLESLKLDPSNPMAHNNIGLALLRLGKLEGGVAGFCRALRIAPGSTGVAANLRSVVQRYPGLYAKKLDDDCRRALTRPAK